jgi:hypothetical protein
VFNVLFVGYSLAKNNLNSTYQYNMIPKKNSKTINYVLKIQSELRGESFFVPVSVYKLYTSILKFNRSRSENYRRPSSVNPSEHYSRPVPGNFAKKFGFEKLTGFLNHKPDLI